MLCYVECTWTLSALEALRYALYKFKTYLLTYLLTYVRDITVGLAHTERLTQRTMKSELIQYCHFRR